MNPGIPILVASLALAGVLPAPAQGSGTSRVGVALVIGNSRYSDAELPTVALDREAMTKALESLGFTVRELKDLQRPRDFDDQLRDFLTSENAAAEDVLVVYYSGHGLQIDGKAHLLGTGVSGSADVSANLRAYAVNVDHILDMMEQAGPASRVLIIDACRNNAFAGAARNAGVAFQSAIQDTYVLFADEPGKTVPARTEASLHSPFTAGLLYAFENSDEGIEARFKIAATKTRELSPEQNPQILNSPSSANRNKPFLDRGGRRAAPSRSAGQLLNDAEEYYNSQSWKAFQDRIRYAKILSSEAALTSRLDGELEFSNHVIAAQAAEAAPSGPKWTEAAAEWQKAGQLFPARAWTLQKAALCWLMADRLPEAVDLLARLRTYSGNPVSNSAGGLMSSLLQAYPSLEASVSSATRESKPPIGPEFERYSEKQ